MSQETATCETVGPCVRQRSDLSPCGRPGKLRHGKCGHVIQCEQHAVLVCREVSARGVVRGSWEAEGAYKLATEASALQMETP